MAPRSRCVKPKSGTPPLPPLAAPRRGMAPAGLRWALLSSTALAFAAPAAGQIAPNARPTGGTIAAGQATIGGNATTTQITQQSQNAVINWQTYNVGSQQTVQYQQPNTRSFTLNRVLASDPSIIAGRITANGQIAIVNQSGVLFAKGSQVDTAGLVATTANVSDSDFMAGRMVFSQAGRAGAMVSNAGNITIRQAGLAALVAPQVANSGTITAQLGRVVLAGATTHTLDMYGDGLTAVNVTGQVTQVALGGQKVPALVTNTGTILAPGGTVVLTAAAADGVVTNLVTAGGTIATPTVGAQTGRVLVQGIGGGVTITGQLAATGTATNTTGGQIVANATGTVTVTTGATIDTSGNAGGGLIALGTTAARAAGGPKVASTLTAQQVNIQQGAVARANAAHGRGGRITVLSRASTIQNGTLTTVGATGGFIEISSFGQLALGGAVSAGIKSGVVLIDPANLDISATETGGGTLAVISPATIQNLVSSGNGNVILAADGEIQVLDPLKLTGVISLELSGNTGINVENLLDVGGKGELCLVSSGGLIRETGVGRINAGLLSASAASGIVLNGQNTIGSIDLVASGNAPNGRTYSLNKSGNATFTTMVAPYSIAGLTATTGAIMLADDAPLTDNANIAGVAVTLTVTPPAKFTGDALTIGPSATVTATGTGNSAMVTLTTTAGILDIAGTVETYLGATPAGSVMLTAGAKNSPGAIIETGAIRTATLAGSAMGGGSGGGGSGAPDGSATLNSTANTVTTLDAFTTDGNFALNDASSLDVAGAVAAGGNVALSVGTGSTSAGTTLTIGANITGSNVTLNTLDQNVGNTNAITIGSGATVDATGALLVVEAVTGNIEIDGTLETATKSGVTASAIASLTALAGSINEASKGAVLIGTLTDDENPNDGTSGTVSLPNSSNNIGTLGQLEVGGDLIVKDSVAPYITGPINVGGAFSLNVPGANSGLLVIGGTVAAGSIDWTTNGGILELSAGSVTGVTSLALTAGGAVAQEPGGLLSSGDSTFPGLIELTANGSTDFGTLNIGTINGMALGGVVQAGIANSSGAYSGTAILASTSGSITESVPGASLTGTLLAGTLAGMAAGDIALDTTSGTDAKSGAAIGNQIAAIGSGNLTANGDITIVDGQNLDIAGSLLAGSTNAGTLSIHTPTLTVENTGLIDLRSGKLVSLVADQFMFGGAVESPAGTVTLDLLKTGAFTVVAPGSAGTIDTNSIAEIRASTLALGSIDGANVYGGGSTGTTWGVGNAGSITDLRILTSLDLNNVVGTSGTLGLFSNNTIENYSSSDTTASYGITVGNLFGAAEYTASSGATLGTGVVNLIDGATEASSNAITTLWGFDTSSTANMSTATASPAFTLQDGTALTVKGPVDAHQGAVLLTSTSDVTLAGDVTGTDVFVVSGGDIEQTGGVIAAMGAAAGSPPTNGTIGLYATAISLAGVLEAGATGQAYEGAILLDATNGSILGNIKGTKVTLLTDTLAAAAPVGDVVLDNSSNQISIIHSLSSTFAGLEPGTVTLYGLLSGGQTGIVLDDSVALLIADDTGTNATVSALGTIMGMTNTGTIAITVSGGNGLTLGTGPGATVEAYGDITLTADGSVLQQGGLVDSKQGNVNVTSKMADVQQIGGLFHADQASVDVSAATSITQTAGTITANTDATLTAGTEIDQTSASTITAVDNAVLTAGTANTGGNVSQSGNSTISAGNTVSIQDVTTAHTGTFTQTTGSTLIAGQIVQIAMGQGIAFGGVLQAGTLGAAGYTGQVWLQSLSRDITETGVANAGTLAASAAGALQLATTSNDIGTIAQLSATFDATTTTLTGLSAGGTQGITLADSRSLTIADSTTVTAATGGITITVANVSAPTLTVGTLTGATLHAQQSVSLTADGAVVQNGGSIVSNQGDVALTSNQGDVVQSGGLAQATLGKVMISAAGNIVQENAGTITAHKSADLTAGLDISQSGASTITADGDALLTAGTSLLARGRGGAISQTGASIITSTGANVVLLAYGGTAPGTGNISQDGTSTITAAGTVSIEGFGSAGGSAFAGAFTQTAGSTIAGTLVQIAAGQGITAAGLLKGGQVWLDTTSGDITETATGQTQPTGTIQAGTLAAQAGGNILLADAGNAIGTIARESATFGTTTLSLAGLSAGGTTGIALTNSIALLIADSSTATASAGGIAVTVTGTNTPALTVGTSTGATLQAAQAITLTADGAVSQTGGSINGTAVTITGAGFTQSASATLYAPGLVHIATSLGQTNSGLTGGAVQIDGSATQSVSTISGASGVTIGGALTQNDATVTANAGAVGIGGNLAQTSSAITAADAATVGGSATQTSSAVTAAAITINGSTTQSASTLTANTGAIIIGASLAQTASQLGAASIVSIGTIAPGTLTQAGASLVNGNTGVSITLATGLTQSAGSTISSAGDITIASSGSDLNFAGLITGANVSLTATAGAINEQAGGQLRATGAATLAAANGVTQTGASLIAGGLAHIAASLTQTQSQLIAAAITIDGGAMQNAASLTATNGAITIGADVSQTGTSQIQTNGGNITIGGSATQAGSEIYAQFGNVTINADATQTAGARIAATGAITIGRGLTETDSFLIGNTIAIGGPLGTTLTQAGSSIIQAQDITANVAGAITQSAGSTIDGQGLVYLTSTGAGITLAGLIQAPNLTLAATRGAITTLAGSAVRGYNTATLNAGAITAAGLIATNQLTLTASQGDVNVPGTIQATSLAGSAGGNMLLGNTANVIGDITGLTAGKTLLVQDSQALTEIGGATIQAQAITLATAGDLTIGGTINATQTLLAQSATNIMESAGATISALTAASLMAPSTVTLMGTTMAPSLLIAADTRGTTATREVDWIGGTLTTASLPPPSGTVFSQNHTYPIRTIPKAGQNGILIVANRFAQSGTTTVMGTGGTPALTVRVVGGGTATFGRLLAPTVQLLLDLSGGGSAKGTVAVAGLNAFYDLGKPPLTPTLLAGTVAGSGGIGAAGFSFAEQRVAGGIAFQTIGNVNYQINGCPLGSSNCVLLSPIAVPIVNPIPDLSIPTETGQQDEDLLPNVAVEDY